jgi:hypothetical protein
MSPETRKTIDIPHPNPVKDCPTCGGSGIEEMRVADADKVDITCRDCLKAHDRRVCKLCAGSGFSDKVNRHIWAMEPAHLLCVWGVLAGISVLAAVFVVGVPTAFYFMLG